MKTCMLARTMFRYAVVAAVAMICAVFGTRDARAQSAAPTNPTSYDECLASYPVASHAKEAAWCFAWVDVVRKLTSGTKNANPLVDESGTAVSFPDWLYSPTHLQDRYRGRYAVFYTSDGQPVAPLPQVGETDTLIVAVLTIDGKATVDDLRIVTCDAPDPLGIEGAAPGGGKRKLVAPAAVGDIEAVHKLYQVRMASRCGSDKGLIATEKSSSVAASTLTVPTLPIYHLTVGLGFVYDWTHTVNYRAATVKGQTVPVIVKDDNITGLNPPIVLISYRPAGVDMSRSRWTRHGAASMFGLSLGLNLADPLNHLYAAFLWEPYPGLGIIQGIHFQSAVRLGGGYNVGDRFPGGGTVPIDKSWNYAGLSGAQDVVAPFVGVSLDATVLAKVIKLLP